MTDGTPLYKPLFNTDVSVFDALDGGAIVHLPLVGRAFRVDDKARRVVEDLLAGKHVLKDEANLAIIAVLERMGILGGERLPEPHIAPLTEFRPIEATLLFTETCNLACSYCYASSVAKKSKPMSETIARAAVDLVINNAASTEKNLAMFRYIGGGEPTIEWGLLTSITSYIKHVSHVQGVNHWIRLITNGTLLTPDRVNWISQNLQFVTLSFDILPELQALRPYNSGCSSHSKVLEVVKELANRGVDFHLRTTVSACGAGRLVDMVRYVHEKTNAKSIRFEPMAEIGRSVDVGLGLPKQQQFVESFIAAYTLGKELGIDVTCKMFQNDQRRSSRFCDAEFSVTPEGIVSACHRYSREDHDGYDLFRIGHFDGQQFQFNIERVNALRAINVHTFSECKTCMARWNCAGGCLSARTGPTGISEKGPLCDLTRDLLKFSIQNKIGAMNVQQ
jgi:uncharacterized protein